MTNWIGAADMTPEELQKCLDEMTDKVHNFYKYQTKRPSRSDRSYLTPTRLGLSNQVKRSLQRRPLKHQRL